MRSCAVLGLVVGAVSLPLSGLVSCDSARKRSVDTPSATAVPDVAVSEKAAPAIEPDKPKDMVARLDAELFALEPCGKHQCATFSDARAALSALLDAGPRVIGVGESHVMKGMDRVPSATERFQKELLPELAERGTSELVVELLKPAPQCEKPVEQVAKQERQVTERQAPENKNRFVELGVAARELGVVPYLLEPECSVYQSIAEAGEDAVLKMLEVIASETERRTRRFYERQLGLEAASQKPRMIVTYGGALHNDVDVDSERAAFSFGPEFVELTSGRYLELDLIVPEFIADTDVWRRLPWYDSFDRSRPREEATLIRFGPRSFVLVFPHTPAATDPGAPPSGTP